jgi:hypothetical protein
MVEGFYQTRTMIELAANDLCPVQSRKQCDMFATGRKPGFT